MLTKPFILDSIDIEADGKQGFIASWGNSFETIERDIKKTLRELQKEFREVKILTGGSSNGHITGI